MLTIGELREKIKDLPADMPVEICAMVTGEDLDVNHASVYADNTDDEITSIFLLEH